MRPVSTVNSVPGRSVRLIQKDSQSYTSPNLAESVAPVIKDASSEVRKATHKNLGMLEKAFATWAPQADGPQDDKDTASHNAHNMKPEVPDTGKDKAANEHDMSEQPSDDIAKTTAAPFPDKEEEVHQDKMSEVNQLKVELAAMQAKIKKISRLS